MIVDTKKLRKRQGLLFRSLPLFCLVLLVALTWNWETKKEEVPRVYNTENDLLVLMQAENGTNLTQVAAGTEATAVGDGAPGDFGALTSAGGLGTEASAGEGTFPELYTEATALVEVPAEEKVCYLTFDDGPSVNTEKILSILEEYDVKATFFVVGSQLHEGTKDTFERLLDAGHAVGIHAFSHEYKKLYQSQESFLTDYERIAQLLRDEYGVEASFFRFPGGSLCAYLKGSTKVLLEEMHRRGYRCFDWNVSGEDSVGEPTVESILQNVYRDVFRYNHPLILLHDSGGATETVKALPQILKRLKEEGYRFETLEGVEEYVFPKSR